MRKLIVFNSISLDGYFCDAQGDMRWAHRQDAEWGAFVSENASGECVLVFGRVTSERMNALSKVVFSRTLSEASWQNTRLIRSDLAAEIRKMKQEPGPDLLILGSGSIVSQLTAARLIDEYQVVLNPIVLGSGRTMFAGVSESVPLALKRTRSFGNGNVALWYAPAL
jgi:dihydrofolate reductase